MPAQEEDKQEEQINYNKIRTLIAWSAPGRPFIKRGKQYYLTAILITFFVEIICFLFSQYILMLVIASLLFLSFALSSVPPRDFHYRVSSEGITVEDHFFLWQELYDFYFRKVNGQPILHVRTHNLIPGELIVPLGPLHKEHVKEVLLSYLPYREVVRPTFMEKSADWLVKNFPLEK